MKSGLHGLLLAAVVGPCMISGAARAQTAQELIERYTQAERAGRYGEAVRTLEQLLPMVQAGGDEKSLAAVLNNLGTAYDNAGQYAKAKAAYLQALAIDEKLHGAEHPDVAATLNNLAVLAWTQGRYGEAEPLFRRALKIRERFLGHEHPEVANTLNNLAILAREQSRLEEAEPLYRKALAIQVKTLGPEHPDVAMTLNNLADLAQVQGRFAEAETLDKRALAIREKSLGPEHPAVADSLNNLANLAQAQGRYSEAEHLYRRALTVFAKVHGPEHPSVADSLNNLAILAAEQGRYGEAVPLYQRALAIYAKVQGPEHPTTASTLNNLATVAMSQSRFSDAELLYQRALAIREKALGLEHPLTAQTLHNLAGLAMDQDHKKEAETLYRRALAIREKSLGPEHPDVASTLHNLASLVSDLGRYEEAEPLVDRALAIRQKTGVRPHDRFRSLWVKSSIAWNTHRRDQAVRDLAAALDQAELQRGLGSGTAEDRARLFAEFAHAFERMATWQSERDDVGQTYLAVERFRGRSLLDQLQASGNPLAGVPREQADRLRADYQQARADVTRLEKEISLLLARKDLPNDLLEQQRLALVARKERAQQEAIDACRAIENASPAARLGRGRNAQPRPLADLAAWTAVCKALALEYFLGEEAGFLLVVGGADQKPKVVRLSLTAAQAQTLGVDAGPLTAGRLQRALVNEKKTGVLQLLQDPQRTPSAVAALAALWEVLIPAAEREAILKGRFQRLVVLPDGPLAMLPFETLVVDRVASGPKYLLDVDAPVQYAPSATILLNLAERAKTPPAGDRQPVLTIGDPIYGEGAASAEAQSDVPGGPRRSASGRLQPLKFAGAECQWIYDTFQEVGKPVGRLLRQDATEGAVRRWSGGREILHFACHGLADQRYGNLFGALALTPGPDPSNPDDDGELQLGEIFGLNLQGCELAILSACETNFGPEQKGEGLLALSRGFLAAGCRRAAATNWLVDDEAAATLATLFCAGVAQAERAGRTPDHAVLLQAAKRRIRADPRWQAPFYWAPMVLIGPQ